MKIAIAQTTTGIVPADEAARLWGLIEQAAAAGAAMLFTPEMSGLLDRDRARAAARVCAQADDPVLAAVRAAAARHRIWVQLGSLALRSGTGGRLVNRGFLIADPPVRCGAGQRKLARIRRV